MAPTPGPHALTAGMIGAEFEEVYQTVHEGRARFWGMGLFGGSNGYWDSATLKVRLPGFPAVRPACLLCIKKLSCQPHDCGCAWLVRTTYTAAALPIPVCLPSPFCCVQLQQIRMDGDMLTEDIDSSFRASLLPVKICYCYQARPSHQPECFADIARSGVGGPMPETLLVCTHRYCLLPSLHDRV